jgi:NAD(P)-dependent dehydrogenase (short-subunit alcohol dehydrogenase family)
VTITSRNRRCGRRGQEDPGAGGHEVIAPQDDVRDPEQVVGTGNELEERAGVPTVVVNNAHVASVWRRGEQRGQCYLTVRAPERQGLRYDRRPCAQEYDQCGVGREQLQRGGIFLDSTATNAETGSGFIMPSVIAKASVSVAAVTFDGVMCIVS